jgi:hypothetical protein
MTNIVEDILTWGIALWVPAGATPSERVEGNFTRKALFRRAAPCAPRLAQHAALRGALLFRELPDLLR